MQEDSSALLFDGEFEKHISETVNDYNRAELYRNRKERSGQYPLGAARQPYKQPDFWFYQF